MSNGSIKLYVFRCFACLFLSCFTFWHKPCPLKNAKERRPAPSSFKGCDRVKFSSSSKSGTHSAQEETKLISVCSYASKHLERAGGSFPCENGGSENGVQGKQAAESILKALLLPPHLLPFHGVGSVGMFFIRRGLFTQLQPLHECVSTSKRGGGNKAQESIYL